MPATAVRHSRHVKPSDWARLGRYVINRRLRLGWDRQSDLADAAGMAVRTIGAIERGDRVRRTTLAKLENALQWAPGSANAVLHGDEPSLLQETEPPYATPDERAIWELDGIDQETRRELIRHLRRRRDGGADHPAS